MCSCAIASGGPAINVVDGLPEDELVPDEAVGRIEPIDPRRAIDPAVVLEGSAGSEPVERRPATDLNRQPMTARQISDLHVTGVHVTASPPGRCQCHNAASRRTYRRNAALWRSGRVG